MLWYKKFKISMPQDLKDVCKTYITQSDHEPFWTYKSVADSKMWTVPPLGPNRVRLYEVVPNETLEQFNKIGELVTGISKLDVKNDLPVVTLWEYDEKFTQCPVHIDGGGEHTGSLVCSITGNFKLRLHSKDEQDAPIIDTVDVDESTLLTLNNTEFPHSVEGQGLLLVFGTDKKMNPQEYFADV
jgi:hypothetical protein